MAYEQKEGQGSLFVADQQGNPNRPNYNGSILINGQRYYISGWLKTSQGGQQYISLQAQLPQAARPHAPQGFQQTGQFPQAPVNQPYQQAPQGFQQTYHASAPQQQGQPQGNPFGQMPSQQPSPASMPNGSDMPAF